MSRLKQSVLAGVFLLLAATGSFVIALEVHPVYPDPTPTILLWICLVAACYEDVRTGLKLQKTRCKLAAEEIRLHRYDAIEHFIHQVFCIVHTPEEDSVPDARQLYVWRVEFLRVNGGIEGLAKRLGTRTMVSMPKNDKDFHLTLQQSARLEVLIRNA